jgi:hypothetical protein
MAGPVALRHFDIRFSIGWVNLLLLGDLAKSALK